MEEVTPDLKPIRRIVDVTAMARARLRWDACAACGRDPGSVHHLIPRSEGGDDVDANLFVVCGNGTTGCHGALHGNPYTHLVFTPTGHGTSRVTSERRDAKWVRERIGATIMRERPEAIGYVVNKLGSEPAAAEYLRRHYHLDFLFEAATVPGETGIPIPDNHREGKANMAATNRPQISAVAAMVAVLTSEGGPLKTKEIAKRVLSRYNTGLKGPTPEATMSAKLHVLAKAGKTFKHVAPGTFDLLDRKPAAKAQAAKRPAAKSSASKPAVKPKPAAKPKPKAAPKPAAPPRRSTPRPKVEVTPDPKPTSNARRRRTAKKAAA